MIHEMKITQQYFADVLSGEKQFEVRKFDRPFHKGDLLALNEYNSETKSYTGRSCLVYIDYLFNDSDYVKSGFVILGIKPCGVHRAMSPYNPLSNRESYSVPLATEGDEQRCPN